MKYIITTLSALTIIGCSSVAPKDTIDEVIPALDEENDLLFKAIPSNVARKSVTHEDYFPPKEEA